MTKSVLIGWKGRISVVLYWIVSDIVKKFFPQMVRGMQKTNIKWKIHMDKLCICILCLNMKCCLIGLCVEYSVFSCWWYLEGTTNLRILVLPGESRSPWHYFKDYLASLSSMRWSHFASSYPPLHDIYLTMHDQQQWRQVSMNWVFQNSEPKYIFLPVSCFVQCFMRAIKSD